MSKNRRNKKNKLLKFIIVIITIILGTTIIGGIYVYQGISKLGGSSNTDSNKEAINILAVGVDIGTPGSKDENDPKRTDTMMIIHYDKISKDVDVISIPRDTLIKINGKNAKINAAHAVGGVSYAIDEVEKLLNIDIDYYGKINYEGFREIIDSIGGVDMEVDNNMDYDDDSQNLHIHFKKGEKAHLDGKKAEEFFRWRKNNNGSGLKEGDLGRIKNQHIFISKVVEKVKTPKIIPRIPLVLNTLSKYCETDMSGNEIIKYSYAISKAENVNMHTLKGNTKYINKISYFIYSENQNRELLEKLNYVGSNLNQNSDSYSKGDLKVKVLNGTKKNGLAANYKNYLLNKGYNNIATGNGESTKETKVLVRKNFNNKQKKYIKNELGIKNVEDMGKKYGDFDIVILLGEDQKYKK